MALDFEAAEDLPKALEHRVKHCLWAKSFRESEAGGTGYAMVCSADFAIAAAFKPKLRLAREKTLMQGQDCRHFRCAMEE